MIDDNESNKTISRKVIIFYKIFCLVVCIFASIFAYSIIYDFEYAKQRSLFKEYYDTLAYKDSNCGNFSLSCNYTYEDYTGERHNYNKYGIHKDKITVFYKSSNPGNATIFIYYLYIIIKYIPIFVFFVITYIIMIKEFDKYIADNYVIQE